MTSMIVIAKLSLFRALPPVLLLSLGLYLVYYQIPFVEHHGLKDTLSHLNGISALLPLAWVAGLFLAPRILSFFYCVAFAQCNAIVIKGGKLIYLTRINFSVPVNSIKNTYAATEPTGVFFLRNLVLITDGGKKYLPLTILDRPASTVERSLRRHIGLD